MVFSQCLLPTHSESPRGITEPRREGRERSRDGENHCHFAQCLYCAVYDESDQDESDEKRRRTADGERLAGTDK